MLPIGIKGYTHSLGGTPLNDSLVFGGLGTVRELSWKQRGDARLASSIRYFVVGGAVLQEGGGLARAWRTTCGPKVISTNAPVPMPR